MLKELIDKGYVFQKEGESDRRQRLLYLTEAGEELRQRLMGPQMNRIRRAVALPDGNAAKLYRKVLYHMVSPANREAVRDWIDRAEPAGRGRRRRWMTCRTSWWWTMTGASATCSSPS